VVRLGNRRAAGNCYCIAQRHKAKAESHGVVDTPKRGVSQTGSLIFTQLLVTLIDLSLFLITYMCPHLHPSPSSTGPSRNAHLPLF
jgi:hypothetical protein